MPLLTTAESDKIDAVINRFIEYDIGKLKGAEGKKALEDFNRLGSESFFNLVEGLNRAAAMEDSCPAVIIAKRLAKIITTTEDPHLLAFAKDSIGAGVTAKRHLGVLQDLQSNILFRNAALRRRGITIASTLRVDVAQGRNSMAEGGRSARAKRRADSTPKPLVQKQSSRPNLLKRLAETRARKEVRIAAAKSIAAKKLRYSTDLIGLLKDSDDDVRQAARRALVQLAGGVDHGPSPDADVSERDFAVKRASGVNGGASRR